MLIRPLLLLLVLVSLQLVGALHVNSVQVYAYHNAKKSNTQKFRTVSTAANSDLILRRGNTFTVTAHLDGDYLAGAHQMLAQFNFENFPANYKRAVVTIKITNNPRFYQNAQSKPDKWHSDLYKIGPNSVTFDVYIPVNLPVGEWYCQLFFKSANGQVSNTFRVPNKIYVLFNPWSKTDDVYLPNEAERQEYVLNDVGQIYTGSTRSKEYRDWHFDTFNRGVLKAVMFIMGRSGLTPVERSDPVRTSRAISAMTNSNDENGVVVGRWKEPYRPYVNPWSWLGSGDIIMKYYREGGNPVKYGQCWVYAGVAVTLGRSLGIPTRPITAYAAAHDTDKSLTIDKYYNIRGQELKDASPDSVWNFHVWNEMWFRRNDIGASAEPLNARAENWQVIDATPQEVSHNGRYELGPTLVAGIRSGDLSISSDMGFVYSEVNSDVVFWYMGRNGQYYKKSVATNSIGTVLVTKGPSGEMIDLTDNYKYREGTPQERNSYKRAKGMVSLRYAPDLDELFGNSENEILPTSGGAGSAIPDEVLCKVVNLADRYPLGAPIVFSVQLENPSNASRAVFLKLTLDSIYYTGKLVANIADLTETITLDAGEVRVRNYSMSSAQYADKLPEVGSLRLTTFANGGLNETADSRAPFYDERLVSIEKPALSIQTKSRLFSTTRPNRVLLRLQNPLDRNLTNCRLFLKDGQMCEHKEVQLTGEIGAFASFEHEEQFVPHGHGKQLQLIALLDCDQLHDVRGHLNFSVKRTPLNGTVPANGDF